jgi:hypothetical protein
MHFKREHEDLREMDWKETGECRWGFALLWAVL